MALTTNMHVWRIIGIVFVLMLIILGVLFYFQELFITLLIGVGLIFITCKLRMQYRRLFKRRIKGRLVKFSLLVVIILISLTGLYWLVDHAVQEIEDVITVATADLPEDSTLADVYSARLRSFIPEKLEAVVVTSANINKIKGFFLNELGRSIPMLTKQLFTALLIVPLLFYIYFRKGKMLMQQFYASVPQKYFRVIKNTITDTSHELNEYFTGKLIQSGVIALVCSLGFFFAGVKAWLFFGILAGFLNIIPFIGPFLGAIPPLFVALLDPVGSVALGVLITVLIAQLIDNFYLQPFMLSSRVKLDPLLAILLVLVFARLFGALGMILAIPIYSVFRVTLRELYIELVALYDKK